MALDQKYPIDLKFARFPDTGNQAVDAQLGILYGGIRNVAGDFYDSNYTPAVPFSAAVAGAVGNGSLVYTFRIRNGLCRVDFGLTFGATTVLGGGVGPVFFTPPNGFPPLAPNGSTGTSLIFNAAAGGVFTGIIFAPNPIGAGFVINIPQIAGNLTPVAPAVFAAGDFIGYTIDYPYVA